MAETDNKTVAPTRPRRNGTLTLREGTLKSPAILRVGGVREGESSSEIGGLAAVTGT